MEKRFAHLSVMAEVAPPMVVTNPDGTYVDATFGRGGHSRRILSLLSPEGRLVAFDRDPQAIESAKEIDDKRFSIIHAPFSHMREELSLKNVDRVAGVFMDIGVSSPQIDDASRGFSFRMDGPLDMRMDTSCGQTAAEWLASASETEIARVIHTLGEERFAKKIARAIVQSRVTDPLVSTQQLAKLVAQVVPANKKDPTQNPATRTFQAIRIHINSELDELSQALELTRVEAHDEKEMLEGIIRFGDKTVSEIMTARIDITDVEIHVSFKELLDVVIESGYSRLPVYDTGEDNMKGIIYSKDLLPYRNESADFEWQKLMRRAYFVPEAKMIDDLLEEFRTKKIHMAIVVDEFGGTSGIVTMEDILEEIVGDINDEYDDDKKQYVKLPDGSFIFDAKILLNDFYKVTGLDEKYFADKIGDSETLAGLILGIKEDFPREKEHIRYAGCDFLILEVDKRRIVKVKLSIIPDEA